jgi:ketosteroid isomerase-like protein
MIDLVALQGWLERYEHAWRSNDPAEIGDLFTTDAVYRWHPWDTPADGGAGRTEIVEAWLTDPDEPGTWTLECEPLAVNGDLGIARCIARYRVSPSRPKPITYHNIWLIRFDEYGRCSEFTEHFMANPKDPGLA